MRGVGRGPGSGGGGTERSVLIGGGGGGGGGGSLSFARGGHLSDWEAFEKHSGPGSVADGFEVVTLSNPDRSDNVDSGGGGGGGGNGSNGGKVGSFLPERLWLIDTRSSFLGLFG